MHKKIVVDCFLVIYAIGKTTFPDKTNQERTRLHHTVADQTKPNQAMDVFATGVFLDFEIIGP